MPTKTKRKIDTELKAKSALQTVREQATMADFPLRYEVHPDQTYAWQLLEQATRAFDARVPGGRDGESACKVWPSDRRARFHSTEIRKMGTLDRRGMNRSRRRSALNACCLRSRNLGLLAVKAQPTTTILR